MLFRMRSDTYGFMRYLIPRQVLAVVDIHDFFYHIIHIALAEK